MHLSEQEIIRREKLEKLLALGIDPYPPEAFEVTVHAEHIKEFFSGRYRRQSAQLSGGKLSWPTHEQPGDGQSFFR